ncbi:MAG TPA: tRNA lysidine(34) synthetase TilS [Tepidisphaeraceae bacterium]|nr:tRNA lysidine(34) synthetase TilS [Tepidisphaeraceae bacterium]
MASLQYYRMTQPALQSSIESVPAGAWAVGVSGGADSVALLRLLHAHRPDLRLHVVHLNHETRGEHSDADAAFVDALVKQLQLPVTVDRLHRVLPRISPLPANRSAMFRAARLMLFRDVVRENKLHGVILAHHRLDQAETLLLRLMRGAGPAGLRGMAAVSANGDLTLLRPLLAVPPQSLRAYLAQLGQPWREDASNASPCYRRNRVRNLLNADPALIDALLALGHTCDGLSDWLQRTTPALPTSLPIDGLDGLPPLVREQAARTWLASAGVPVDDLNDRVAARLLQMMDDAASGRRADFPGAVRVTRKRREIVAEPSGKVPPSHPAVAPLQSPPI